MAILALIRHGETNWNAQGILTGQADIPLNPRGIAQAKSTANLLGDTQFQKAYTSNLLRAKQTLFYLQNERHAADIEVISSSELNERNYGDFEGKSKTELTAIFGADVLNKLRHSWDYPVPNGESLKDVYNRVVPFYEANILPDLKRHCNILVVAHNNTNRALIKHIEKLSVSQIERLELQNGEVAMYTFDKNAVLKSKKVV